MSHKLTKQTFEEFVKAGYDHEKQPHYVYLSPHHKEHRRQVRILLDLKCVPSKSRCPICSPRARDGGE